MTPVTKISASTENDITIHAINEEGLSIFAKMQVKLLPGEKPSISVSAVDANSYTSVSFNLTDAQDMTSYKYLLYNADSPAPTEASFANATISSADCFCGLSHTMRAVSYFGYFDLKSFITEGSKLVTIIFQ